MIGIYKIINPNGKIYIGQSIDIDNRKNHYSRLDCKGQPLLCRSIQKYGWENHTHELIEECSVEQLNEREIYYTEYYDALSPNGLVLRAGGRSGYWSDEVKNRIGEGNKGKILSEEAKYKIGQSSKGNQNMTGKKHTNETKQKMSESHLGKQDTEQTKNKKSQSAKGKIKNETHRTNLSKSCSEAFGRPVIQKSINGEFIKEWNTGKQAAVELNLSYTSINNCCRRKEINPIKYTYSQGFIFEYKFPN